VKFEESEQILFVSGFITAVQVYLGGKAGMKT